MVDAVEVEVELEETTVTLSVFERDHWQKLEDYGWIPLVDLDLPWQSRSSSRSVSSSTCRNRLSLESRARVTRPKRVLFDNEAERRRSNPRESKRGSRGRRGDNEKLRTRLGELEKGIGGRTEREGTTTRRGTQGEQKKARDLTLKKNGY